MPGLMDYLPSADDLLALGPEDLGMIVLEIVQKERSPFAVSNIEMPVWNANNPAYPHGKRRSVQLAMAAAWQWLQKHQRVVANRASSRQRSPMVAQ